MISIERARALIASCLRPLPARRVVLEEAHGAAVLENVTATRDLPPWDNSAMDGFAVRCGDLPGTLPVSMTVRAGDDPDRALAPGSVARIMTGAPIPRGAEAVVMREQVVDHGDRVDFAEAPAPGAHIRRAGEDVHKGDEILAAGTALGAGELGLLAALGHAEVVVGTPPRCAILSSGDELVPLGAEPRPGQIISSNAIALAAQVRRAGGLPVDLGIVRDTPVDLRQAIERGLRYDVLLTSGGVSMGDFDFIGEIFDELGVERIFTKVAIKPGKPLLFGTRGQTLVFGLPGNPISTMVCFEILVRPALRALLGASGDRELARTVPLGVDVVKAAGRTLFSRARLHRIGDETVAIPIDKQGSGMLSSMVGVDVLLELSSDVTHLPAGTWVTAHRLAQP